MTPLRIGIDARELLGDSTGVGRYLGELLRRWAARDDAGRRQFLLYAPGPLTLALPAGVAEPRIVGKGTGTWWEQTALRGAVRADRPDVFFAPAYTAPLGIGVPLAVTIHDVSFTAHPEWFRTREGMRRRFLTRRAAQDASVVFTVSEFSRREIEAHLGVPRNRIEVIPQGTSALRDRPSADVPNMSRHPLVLYVGTLFNRRRLPDLIAAFAQATEDMPAARLAIVGADRTWPSQDLGAIAQAYGLASRVDIRSYVPEEELAQLYARASVFAFLSEYEGFGLTPLEAMAAGVPAVVLDTTVAREVYGDAATYVADIASAATALRRFLTTPAAAADMRSRAPAVLARYSWDRAADRTLDHLERVARR
jgi:glycosyltransferase involved in cell wall biosynthesis